MRFKRIIASVLTVACLFTCFATIASAEVVSAYNNGAVSPQYSIASSVYSALKITGTTAECVSSATGANTVKISVVHSLEK